MAQSNPSGAICDQQHRLPRRCQVTMRLAIVLVLALLQLLPLAADCQDFEDLNNKQTTSGNLQTAPQVSFQQQFNRQQQQQPTPQSSANNAFQFGAQQLSAAGQQLQQPGTSPRQGAQAPRQILTGRFNPQSLAAAPIAQASTSSASFASPAQAAGPSTQQASNNVEQLMKNALTRTARVEAAAELRQDPVGSLQPEPPQAQSRQGQLRQPSSPTSATVASAAPGSTGSSQGNPATEGEDEGDKSTTEAQTTTTSGHETVYSDQRFANLFARRNGKKVNRLNPTEQIKAKPTLPSFIKSPPDPKQFTAVVSERPSSAPAITSARLQSQPSNTKPQISPLSSQQKKPAITSSSAASANNKRNNALNGNSLANNRPSSSSSSGPKLGNPKAASSLSTTSKPVALNNPFSRQNNNDPASVIAAARKRLLANNAIESAKLKQQKPQTR